MLHDWTLTFLTTYGRIRHLPIHLWHGYVSFMLDGSSKGSPLFLMTFASGCFDVIPHYILIAPTAPTEAAWRIFKQGVRVNRQTPYICSQALTPPSNSSLWVFCCVNECFSDGCVLCGSQAVGGVWGKGKRKLSVFVSQRVIYQAISDIYIFKNCSKALHWVFLVFTFPPIQFNLSTVTFTALLVLPLLQHFNYFPFFIPL